MGKGTHVGSKGQEALEPAVPLPGTQSPSGSSGDAHTVHSCCLLSLAPGPLTPQPKSVPGGGAPDTWCEPRGPAHCCIWPGTAPLGVGHCLWVARHFRGHTKRGVIEASLVRGLFKAQQGCRCTWAWTPMTTAPPGLFPSSTHCRQLLREAPYEVFKELIYGPED